jgi:hypothetical protein
MLVHAGSPRVLGVDGFSGETLEFDFVDRRFATMVASAFVLLIAVVVWMWLTVDLMRAPGLHAHGTSPFALGNGGGPARTVATTASNAYRFAIPRVSIYGPNPRRLFRGRCSGVCVGGF